jgi:S1-C subfamily serine protease
MACAKRRSIVTIVATAPLALALAVQGCAAPRASLPSPTTPSRNEVSSGTSEPSPPEGSQPVGIWIATKEPDLRKLTVLISVKPPKELVAKYAELADHDQRMKPFFQAAATGGFGSGFVLVRREASGSGKTGAVRRFIVTNWHVVQLAPTVAVSFNGSKSTIDVPVVYVDPAYDLAVLSLDRVSADVSAAASIPEEGFDFATAPAKDQEPVVASGYPPIADAPSYQVTRGYVSNERFEITEGGHAQQYIQHTAPIDPGSSGGPLTTPEGKVLGVNTMKVRRRENVGLAVPAAAVVEAIHQAASSPEGDAMPRSAADARAACEGLLAGLARGKDDLGTVERALGGSLVAREGFPSLDELPRGDVAWVEAFLEEPVQVLLHAIALRLLGETAPAPSTCEPSADDATSDSHSFKVHTRHGERTWIFGWEQHRWKLVQASFAPPRQRDSFFRGDAGSKGPHKKWTPSLR